MNTMPKQPLAITPSPAKGEALPSFILRASTVNGYANPSKLLRYADMTDNEARSARPPLIKLAPLFGKTTEELIAAGLDYIDDSTPAKHLTVSGHHIPFMYTRSKNAGFCLQCVQENGFIESFHELKYALACPRHQCKAMLSCPSCKSPLNWHRRNLSTCSCGANLSASPCQKVEHAAILALLGILNSKLMRTPLNKADLNVVGFPIEAIERLSIQTLLCMIYRFGLFNQKRQVADNELEADWQALQTTAEVLSNWPNKFHDYLESVHAPNANLEVSGLRGQFNSFFESFFKNIEATNELVFMRDAFVSFGQRWKKAAINPKLASNQSSNVVGINGLAKAIHVQPSTARKLVAKGLIQVQSRSDTAIPRSVFDVNGQHRFAFAEGSSLSVKHAAQMLDIPVDILRAYRARGYYQARYLAIPVTLFHERDVEQLRQDLMQNCKVIKVLSRNHITLAQIMRTKHSAEIKAAFIDAVKTRTNSPLGKLSDQPSGLVFDRLRARNYLQMLKIQLQGGVTFEEVDAKLKLNREVVFSLIKADVLQCIYHQDIGMRVSEKSLNLFEGRFISCKELAYLKTVTQKSLIELCHSMGVSLYQLADARTNQKPVLWIERKDMPLLGLYENEGYFAKAA